MLNKRLIATTALLGASLIAGFASAQDFGRARGEHARPARPGFMQAGGRGLDSVRLPARLITRLDANDDSMVSLEEFTANATENYVRQFERMDRDDSGSLSADEMQGRRGHKHDGDQDRPVIDTDALNACIVANGGIVRPIPPSAEERFATADSNSDGLVSQEEFFMQLEQRAYEQFGELDSDGNGLLTVEELQSEREDRSTQARITRSCVAEQIATLR